MKTFDEATKEILSTYQNAAEWHSAYCRCAEISSNKEIKFLGVSLTAINMINFITKQMDAVDMCKNIFETALELGVAIGQKMNETELKDENPS